MGYTNSPLATYTNLSSKHSGMRKYPITRITPHCIVGQFSAKRACDYFKTCKADSSANYCVGKDGDIGLCVEEKNRSWCSSNSDNDNRAITIEVASETSHPYAFTGAAYEGLIKLCADICKRNGKDTLIWFNDKNKTLNYQPKPNEMVLTVHRWFANKSCPGDWLFSRMGDLANKVNALIGSGKTVKPVQVTTPLTVPSAGKADSIIWNFLKSKGLSDYGVAGLMGNLQAESGLSSINLQNSFESKLGFNDTTYTQAVDNGSYTNFVKDSAGYGLAQWTYWSRKQNLLNYAKSKNKSIGDLTMQLEFLWNELQQYKTIIPKLQTAKSVLEASNVILKEFEKPADQGIGMQNKRASLGQTFYNDFATGATHTPVILVQPKPSYTVGKQYTLQTELRVRIGAGTTCRFKTHAQLTADGQKHDVNLNGCLDKGTVITCLEVKNVGDDIWVRCPSGWIAAYYRSNIYIK